VDKVIHAAEVYQLPAPDYRVTGNQGYDGRWNY